MIDPNLGGQSLSGVKRITGFIEDNTEVISGNNVVMSHVLEHLYSPGEFLKMLSENIELGDKIFLSTPQIYEWLKLGSPNALNFEHSYFLSIDQVEAILADFGFILVQQESFDLHSIFSVFEKSKSVFAKNEKYVNRPEHKSDFLNYIKKQIDFCQFVNESLKHVKTDVYLFGASLFSQALLSFGLAEKDFKGVLDNSKSKNGERLYGSQLFVKSPEEISHTDALTVVLRMGPYQSEIKNQLKQINESINILE
jgi:hypothetical protein